MEGFEKSTGRSTFLTGRVTIPHGIVFASAAEATVSTDPAFFMDDGGRHSAES
jgi:hypothetical protein